MGVLDEAIRNHLELRRRAGASEAELARAEAEALGPARRDPAADIFADEGPAAAAVATTVLDPVQAEESNRAHEQEPPPLDTGVDHEAQTAIFDLDQDELAPPPPARPPLREVDSELPMEESVVEGSVVEGSVVEEQTVEEPPIDREPPVDEVPVEEPPPVEPTPVEPTPVEPTPVEPTPVEPTPAEDEPPPSPVEPPAAAQPPTEPHPVEPPLTADPHRHPADGD